MLLRKNGKIVKSSNRCLGDGTVYVFDLKSNELKARVGSNPTPGTV